MCPTRPTSPPHPLILSSSQSQHPKTGAYVEGVRLLGAATASEALGLLEAGSKARTIHATTMNASSSRAHTVVTIHITQTKAEAGTAGAGSDGGATSASQGEGGPGGVDILSKLNLIDLAGSERTHAADTRGARLKEGTAINKSLSALGKW